MALVLWKAAPPPGGVGVEGLLDVPPGAAAVSGTEATKGPDTTWVLAAYGLVVAAAFGAWGLFRWIDPASLSPPAGFSMFAPLYILAQSIERLLEPFAKFLGAASENGETKSKEAATQARDATYAALAAEPTPAAATAAASAQALLERIRRNTTVIAWGVASALGMLACGAFGIRLLAVIGFDVPAFWDIAITGLAVGSGTKPLHDLISNLQKAKDNRANPPGTATVN